ncbi:MAG: small conductance mechanosensitive channel [Streptosporangiaceae bacterium]|nr:small conductance mechanosensitive channel [Streptosporangiaceae bacterium]
MDLQEKRQYDLARQMAKVRRRARPWRSIIAAVLAVLVGLTSYSARHGTIRKNYSPLTADIIAQSAAVVFCVLAVIAVLGLAKKAQEVLRPAVGTDHAAVVRYAILLVGGITALLLTLEFSGVPVGQLVLGGAVTGILLGIAGQQTLANVFAGLVLLLSRPFGVGDLIRLRSGALGGQLEGTVTEIGITYLRLETPDGVLHVPNAQVLAAAAGPIADSPQAGTVQAGTVEAGTVGAGTVKPEQASTAGGPVPPAPGSAGPPTGGSGSANAGPPTGGSGSAGPSTGSAGPPDGGQPPGVP